MSENTPEANKDSPDDSTTPAKPGAPKNKQCPFCGDYFTSSSLGRHLDLYIKDKNPKPVDGLHDVDKIRQLRANITRRQPRRSTHKIDVSTPASNGSYPPGGTGSPYGFVIGTDEHKRILINRPTWEATGVMRDIPPNGLRLDLGTRKHLNRSDVAMKKRMLEDRTRLRAAELALQEVLDSVNAASAQAYPPSPLDFDFLSHSFPALCLRLLPKQPSIGALQVIENPKSCPVGPPNKIHYELLRQRLKQKLEDFQRARNQAHQRRELREIFPANNEDRGSSPEEADASSYYNHLDKAFDVWKSTPDSQKASLWHLETLRAYSSTHDEVVVLQDKLAQAEVQMTHLRLQIARLSECQQPREYTYNIPVQHEISPETAQILSSSKADVPLDRESLIKKWAAIVRDDRKYQRHLPELDLADLSIPDNMNMENDLQEERAEGNEDDSVGEGNSVDAAGDDDDEVDSHPNGLNGNVHPTENHHPVKIDAGVLDRGVMDPSLQGDEDDGAMDVDKGDFGAEMLLADMRARAQGAE